MNQSLFVLFAFLALTFGHVIDNNNCTKGPDSRSLRSVVHEIRVSPCPEAAEGEPCTLEKGTSAQIAVDFVPTMNARRIKAGMFWMSTMDMPFRGMSVNACRSMACPLRAGTTYNFNTTIALAKSLPTGMYPIKFKLYEGRHVIVCQTFSIRLVEPPQ